MRERIQQELALLKQRYGEEVFYVAEGDWFLIARYPLPDSCQPRVTQVCFNLKPGYPGVEPYGFFVAAGVTCNGVAVVAGSAPAPPPFPGQWTFVSWAPEGWLATADVVTGANLWAWARSFAARLGEGA
jgi:hypothetical protein